MRPPTRSCLTVLALFAAFTGVAAAEDQFDGSHLLRSCGDALAAAGSSAAGADAGRCVGFVYGATAAHELDVAVARRRNPGATSKICVPADATVDQDIRVFHDYLKANPEKLHLSGIELLYAAYLDHWPCPAKPAR